MKQWIIRKVIRRRFASMSLEAATDFVRSEAEATLALVRPLDEEAARRAVRVPPMRGVDEDMRAWSLCMLLEHNTIVTREMTRIMSGLARGEPVESRINPKTDVMPSAAPGLEQLEAFQASVEAHLAAVEKDPPKKGTATFTHPLFGELDAHGWNCMCGFHLQIHRKQAEAVVALLREPA